MRTKNFEGLRKTKTLLNLKQTEAYKEDIDEAIEYFHKARTAFLQRLQRKEREASTIAQLIEKLPENNPKTSGYASQIKSVVSYLRIIVANIDYLLGSPCHEGMFAVDGISADYSKKLHDSFIGLGLISPTLLTGRPVENWQIEQIKRKYKMQKNQIKVRKLNKLSF
jgi:hypothetical protein